MGKKQLKKVFDGANFWRARHDQKCKECQEPIKRGEYITKLEERYLHAWCGVSNG